MTEEGTEIENKEVETVEEAIEIEPDEEEDDSTEESEEE